MARASGAFSLSTGEARLRTTAARLAVAGLLAIEKVAQDGSLRLLTPADVLHARSANAWRVRLATDA